MEEHVKVGATENVEKLAHHLAVALVKEHVTQDALPHALAHVKIHRHLLRAQIVAKPIVQ